MDRRAFLASAAATLAASAASPGWAAAGAPSHVAAAKLPDGSYALVGLTGEGAEAFRIPLPDRGHAAAAHPHRPLAVAFARRPGTFGLVIDCAGGRVAARLESPAGRHFYGHGCFSEDGLRLYTPENAYEAGEGRIGVWDAETWARLDEFPSGGVGPHDVLLAAPGVLAVANGGILTHPAMGRAKLNLPSMRPNLAYVSAGTGRVLEVAEPPEHLASLRHLARRSDGLVAAAMQWQGDLEAAPAMLALHRRGEDLRLLKAPDHARLKGYGGSVAFSGDGARVAVTSPRGGVAQVFDAGTGAFLVQEAQGDVCGAAPCGAGMLLSDGTGGLRRLGADGETAGETRLGLSFDNHLVPVGPDRRPV